MTPDIPVRKQYAFERPSDLGRAAPRTVPIVIVGGGPVGLTIALDLGQRGHDVVVLNQMDILADGSKAICFSKRTLDIYDRLGVGERMIDTGVVWNVG
ncbi:MAG: FAD-dependent oxidoreductase, partial [Pseudomonadota bacterium]